MGCRAPVGSIDFVSNCSWADPGMSAVAGASSDFVSNSSWADPGTSAVAGGSVGSGWVDIIADSVDESLSDLTTVAVSEGRGQAEVLASSIGNSYTV